MNIEIEYERLLERQRMISKTIQKNNDEIKELETEIKELTILFQLFSSVLISMRKTVIKRLRSVITPVIKHVFADRKFSFDIQYKRVGTNHYYTPIIRDGKKIRFPKYESGGGIIPILDFALRVAFLEFGSGKLEKVLFLDEPFGWLGNLSYKATDIIIRLSRKLGIQFIINTHDRSTIDFADKKWEVVCRNGKSSVKEM